MNDTTKRIIPHIIAAVLMLAISCAFFAPRVFGGKVINQFDNFQARGMQAEIMKHHKEKGETILWTNAAFGGMPTAQVHLATPGNLVTYPFYALTLYQGITAPHTAAWIGMLCMYLLLIVLKVDWRLAIAGGIAMGLCNYNMDLYVAGHSTKILAVAFLPAVMAGTILMFRKKWLIGGAVYGLALAMQLYSNHLQITYYTGFLVGFFVLINLIFSFIDEKEEITDNLKSLGFLVLFSIIAFATGLPKVWTTQEYASESQRGISELAAKQDKNGNPINGLTKDYGMSYSLTPMEALLPSFAPNYYGGGSEHNTIENTKIFKKFGSRMTQNFTQEGMNAREAKKKAKETLARYTYTANTFTPGVSIYFGIVVWLLFIIGLILVHTKEKWWLAISALFMLCIAMGDSFPLNGWMFDNFPLFNKFRAMSMAMGLVQVAILGLAFLTAQKLLDKDGDVEKKKRAILIGGGITLGILVLMYLTGSGASGPIDNQLANNGAGFMDALRETRDSLMTRDVLGGMLFVVLAAALLWAFVNKKINALIAIAGIVFLTVIDVWSVSKRVAGSEKYHTKQANSNEVPLNDADQYILNQEGDSHYRVLDFTGEQNPFSDARASYHHPSIGGYFSAKLMLFEELKNKYFSNPNAHRNILGMMNTKYIISNQDGRDIPFPIAETCGNAWFVNDHEMVPNADAELNGLQGLDTKNKALIQQKYAGYMDGFQMKVDSTASIALTSYHPDKMEYTYSASEERLAMFSEMFYNPSKGWKVYLNGEEINPFIKANFAIRAMRLPAGQNQKLVMEFKPRSYYLGNKVALFSSLLLLIGFVGICYQYFKKNGLSDPTTIVNDSLPKVSKEKTKPTVPKSEKTSTKKKKRKKR